MKTRPSRKQDGALTLIEVIAIIAVLSLLIVLFLLPWFGTARSRSRTICCNCNLKQIGLSFRLWESDHKDQYPSQVAVTNGGTMEFTGKGSVYLNFLVLSNELNTTKILVCPSDRRTPAPDFATLKSDLNVSYFVGLDADETTSTDVPRRRSES